MPGPFPFHDEGALLERLSNGVRKYSREVVFLVGAPMSSPISPGKLGVPDVDGMIALIKEEFKNDPLQQTALERAIETSGDKKYQAAFVFLQGRRGQTVVNEIVRKAVL